MSQLRASLSESIPGFVEWFLDMRGLRNDMKLGVGTGHGARLVGERCDVQITIQRAVDSPREVNVAREIAGKDMDEAVSWCSRFWSSSPRRRN